MATGDIRIGRVENGVHLLEAGQRKILDKIDELFARQDKLSAKLDKLLAKQEALSPKSERDLLEEVREMEERFMSLQSNEL